VDHLRYSHSRLAPELGIAIRYAQALGLHRASVNKALPPRERLLRKRVWATLYIYDRFHSAVLGRPYAIEDQDWDDREPADNSDIDRYSMQMVRISHILGDVCNKVYRPQTISSEAASALARRLQEWSDSLPADMNIHALLRNKTMPLYDRQVLQRLHLSHLNAVILLTRPFFFYVVASEVTQGIPPGPKEATAKGTVGRLARACVLSATRSVEIVNTLFLEGARPPRPPFLIHFMFYAGLILLLDAYRDKSLVGSSAISNVKLIMASYAGVDPSAKRYLYVFEEMSAAIRNSTQQPPPNNAAVFLDRWQLPAPPPGVTPPNSNLSQFLSGDDILDGTPGFKDIFSFDFDPAAFWGSMMIGEGDFRGMLLQPEF